MHLIVVSAIGSIRCISTMTKIVSMVSVDVNVMEVIFMVWCWGLFNRVHYVAVFRDDGLETIVLVGSVLHLANGAISVHEGVLALHYITVAYFMLRFVITGVWVFNTVFVFVFWVSLAKKKYTVICIFSG